MLVLENPGEPGKSRITNSLFAGIQLIMPGEIADVHRHSASAIRFVLEGEGAYTAVEGEKSMMEHGDFIITANWAPHDHGNPGKEPVMWLDVLDMPTINHFETSFAEHPDEQDAEDQSRATATRSSATPPACCRTARRRSQPLAGDQLSLRQDAADPQRLKKTGDIDKRHGARVRYANPINGGPVLPTMGAYLALLPKGFKGEPYRSTDGTIFAVAEGSGTTMIDGKPFEWSVNDVFVVPPWKRYHAQRGGGGGAVLDLRPAGAGSARPLARRVIAGQYWRSITAAPLAARLFAFAARFCR